MTPTYSCKNQTTRYRYYVCCSAQKRGFATCPSKAIPADAIEQLVLERIRQLGNEPALLQAARAQAEGAGGADLAEGDPSMEEADRAGVLALLDPTGKALAPAEQARLLGLLVQRVDYDGSRGKVAITFHARGLAQLAEALLHLPEEAVP
jgi:hypothetical protein